MTEQTPARDRDTGIVKSVERIADDTGKIVLRATVDFYDGDAPNLTFRTVWDRRPVKITEVNPLGERAPKEGK